MRQMILAQALPTPGMQMSWHNASLQCPMVGKPLRQKDLDKLRIHARRLKRMKDAHLKGRHWKRCVFCV